MTEPAYVLTAVRRQRQRPRSNARQFYLNLPHNDGYWWRLTATKLRQLCDAAGDALDTGAGTVGPFHVTSDASGNYVVLDNGKRFELAEDDLIDLIAEADELMSDTSGI